VKIDINKTPESQGQGQSRTAQNVQKTPAVAAKNSTTEVRKTNPGDKVDISTRSKEIADIMSAVNQLPDVRAAKVTEIKKSVDAGTYTVDPLKIAEKILKEI
jgi:negative regulator of flagellin synthesis FlgM